MKFIIKQFFISLLFLTITLGGCGEFTGNYEEIETSVSNSTDNNTDTTPPTVSSTSPSDSDTSISLSSLISVTFSEAMDTTSVTTNTSDTSCSGTFQVSSDSFSTCIQMNASPSVSNSSKTFSVTPSDNLSYSTVYKIRVTTGVKDSLGNSMSSQYEMSNGFSTACANSSCVITLTVVGSNGKVCVELNKWSGCSGSDTKYTAGTHTINVTSGNSIGFEISTNSGNTFKVTEPNGNIITGSSGIHRGPHYNDVSVNKNIKVEFL